MAWKPATTLTLVLISAGGAMGQTRLLQLHGGGSDAYGRSVAIAGDVNQDGYADVIIGANQGDASSASGPGYAEVRSGKDGSVLYTFTGALVGDNFGWSVGAAGDVNQDGHPDVIVGAPIVMNGHRRGYADVYSGKDGALLRHLVAAFNDTQFGLAVSGAQDVDGDGIDDVIVGAPFENSNGTDSGTARVFSGKDGSVLFTFNGDSGFDYFSWSVGGAGDTNQDGFADLVVGADWDDKPANRSGSATIFSGKDGGVLRAFAGDSANDLLGHSVAGAGDVNHDGFADVVVGAPQDGAPGYGRVYSGKDGAILFTSAGDGNSVDFGIAVAGAGDVDHDGFDDLIYGDWLDQTTGVEAGAAWVFSGKNGALLYEPLGAGTLENFGAAVGGGGDLNQDGFSDFVVAGYTADKTIVYSGQKLPASWANYGAGYPGTNGIPDFTSEPPVICTNISLVLENSRGATTPAVIVIGLSDAHIPTGEGGILLVLPSFIVPVVLPAGGLSADVDVPCDTAFCGLALYLQALESDPGAQFGVSFSVGLKMVLGGD